LFYTLAIVIGLQALAIAWLALMLSQTRRRLVEAESSLRDADQVKTDFLSNVSHELRTPMTGIKGYVDNMLDGIAGEITEKQKGYLERVKANADRLTALINDLLDLSRIDRGRADLLSIGYANFDVSQVVTELAGEYEAKARSRGLSFVVDAPSTTIYSDPSRTRQSLQHLLNNAIKFTSSGGIRVSVQKGQDGFVEISIEDTGPGVPADQSERIFDRFYQVQDEQNLTPGSGLGLSIAREFTDIMGGRVWLKSSGSEGSTFAIALPESVAILDGKVTEPGVLAGALSRGARS